MVKTPADIYAETLLPLGHGYPLYEPELHERLNDPAYEAYRKQGITIGDVGIIRHGGDFDFLFNIDNPPMNRQRGSTNARGSLSALATGVQALGLTVDNTAVASSTSNELQSAQDDNQSTVSTQGSSTFSVPISLGKVAKRRRYPHIDAYGKEEKTDVSVAISVKPMNCTPVEVDAGWNFECSTQEGAIVVACNGSTSYDALEYERFLNHLSNVKSWFAYATDDCYRKCSSLILVTGVVKCNSWIIAAFSDYSREHSGSLSLSINPVDSGSASVSHNWREYRPSMSRSGPLLHTGAENQCLYVRGYRIMRNWDFVHRLRGVKVTDLQENDTFYYSPKTSGQAKGSSFSGNSLGTLSTPTGDSITRDSSMGQPSVDGEDDFVIESLQRLDKHFHPSDVINEYLLEKFPKAKFAVTHDDRWITLLQDKKIVSFVKAEILSCICKEYKATISDGVVYLDPDGKLEIEAPQLSTIRDQRYQMNEQGVQVTLEDPTSGRRQGLVGHINNLGVIFQTGFEKNRSDASVRTNADGTELSSLEESPEEFPDSPMLSFVGGPSPGDVLDHLDEGGKHPIPHDDLTARGASLTQKHSDRFSNETCKIKSDVECHPIDIPNDLHRRLIGANGQSIRSFEAKHHVRVEFDKDKATIMGPSQWVEEAKTDLLEIVKQIVDRQQCLSREVTVLSHAVTHWLRIQRATLKQLTGLYDILIADDGSNIVTLKGPVNALDRAEDAIRAVERSGDSQRVVAIPVDLRGPVVGGKWSKWTEMVVRCGGPKDPLRQRLMIDIPEKNSTQEQVTLRGNSKVIDDLVKEIQQIVTMGVYGMRISIRYHKKLQSQLRSLAESTGTKIFLPGSGPHSQFQDLVNAEELRAYNVNTIVKIIGPFDGFCRVRSELKERIHHLRQRTLTIVIPLKFEKAIYEQVKRALRDINVTISSQVDTRTPFSPVRSRPPEGEEFSWSSIRRYDNHDTGECEWTLEADSKENVEEAYNLIDKAYAEAQEQDCVGFLTFQDCSKFGRIIGTGGETCERIQKETRTIIQVPRKDSPPDLTTVVIIGSENDIEEAKNAIIKLTTVRTRSNDGLFRPRALSLRTTSF